MGKIKYRGMGKIKLKSRLILFTVLICILSIVSVSLINYNISIKGLERDVNIQVGLEGKNITKDIDKWVGLQKKALDEVIENMVMGNNFEKEFTKTRPLIEIQGTCIT